MTEKTEVDYGSYRLVAAEHQGEAHAIAFLGRLEILRATAQTVIEAMAELQVLLHRRADDAYASPKDEIPSPRAYSTALRDSFAIVSPIAEELVRRHVQMPGRRATIEALARSCRVDVGVARLAYTELAEVLSDALSFVPTDDIAIGTGRSLQVLCEPAGADSLHQTIWMLRANVARALAHAPETRKEGERHARH